VRERERERIRERKIELKRVTEMENREGKREG
jgi:hypothetical protein